MIIIKEKEFRLVEMAKLKNPDIPRKIADRTIGLVVDDWWFDENERNDLYKVGFRLILATNLRPYQGVKFDFGFLRPYKNIRQGKSTGTRNDPNYEFRAVHVISTVPGAEGQWYRDDFRDDDFEDTVQYEDDININTLDAKGVIKVVRDLKLKPSVRANINILSILDRLLK
jgi:hypothetical protein